MSEILLENILESNFSSWKQFKKCKILIFKHRIIASLYQARYNRIGLSDVTDGA